MNKIYGLKGLCDFFDISMARARNLVKHGCVPGYINEIYDIRSNKVVRVWDARALEEIKEFVHIGHFQAIKLALHYKQIAKENQEMTEENNLHKLKKIDELNSGMNVELQNGCKYRILEIDKTDYTAEVELLNSQRNGFYNKGDRFQGWFSELGPEGDVIFCSRRSSFMNTKTYKIKNFYIYKCMNLHSVLVGDKKDLPEELSGKCPKCHHSLQFYKSFENDGKPRLLDVCRATSEIEKRGWSFHSMKVEIKESTKKNPC